MHKTFRRHQRHLVYDQLTFCVHGEISFDFRVSDRSDLISNISGQFHRLVTNKSSHRTSCRPATLLKKRLWDRCFPVNFAKLLRTTFLQEHLWWLLFNEKTIGNLSKYAMILKELTKNLSNVLSGNLLRAIKKFQNVCQIFLLS